MSKPSAIAAVTAVLQNLMATIEGAEVTSLPPDVAREHSEHKTDGTQINLYLYQVAVNAARRNDFTPYKSASADAPRNVAPIALNLYYLVTAYGPAVLDDWESQRVLGEAMRLLNDQPLLDRERIRKSLPDTLAQSGLDLQPEMLRFTPHQLSLDDMYKIWSGFQKPYRLSVAYEASVVLIDSDLTPHRARPVLTRGAGDSGAVVKIGLPPRLDSVRFPLRANTSRGGFSPAAVQVKEEGTPERIILVGAHFDCQVATVQFRPADGVGVIERPAYSSPEGIIVELSPLRPTRADLERPADGKTTLIPWLPEFTEVEPPWHPGFYAVTFVANERSGVGISGPDQSGSVTRMRSNTMMVPLAPHIMGKPKLAANGATLLLKCKVEPAVRPGQRLMAIVGQQYASRVAKAGEDGRNLDFDIPRGADLIAGRKVQVRLRVDEVENLSLVEAKSKGEHVVFPAFGTELEVTVP